MVSFPIFSLVALLLGVATEFMGIFDPANEWLRGGWESGGIDFSTTAGLTGPTGFLIGLVSVFALVAAILGTPGGLRRTIIGRSDSDLCRLGNLLETFRDDLGNSLGLVFLIPLCTDSSHAL